MNKPIKVVHMTTVHHPYDPRIYYKQCMSLQQSEQFDVTLIAQSPEGGIDGNKPVEHIILPSYRKRLARMFFGAAKTYNLAKKMDADIYVFHDPELLFVGKLLKKKNNVVIYDIHEDYVTSILQKEYLKPWLRKLMAKGYGLLEKNCTKGMSLSLAEKYYKENYPQGKCILNYPIVRDIDMLNQQDHRPIENKLLYTGNVDYDRGALQHAELPVIDEDVEMYLIGKCASSLAREMNNAAGTAKERLYIEGIDTFVVKDRIDEMYQKYNWLAGVALFPPTEHYMKKELTKFFEYMAAGIPVLCSNFPEWEAFVQKHQCGLTVDPNDKKEIQKAITFLKTHPETAKEFGENGKQAISQSLNWKAEEKKLFQWYDELVKETC